MANLKSIREKLTIQAMIYIVLLLATAVILAGFYLPTRNTAKDLQAKIDQVARDEQTLLRVVEQLPGLEEQQARLEENLLTSAKYIPSQYDLPEVLEGMRQLSTYYGLELASLDHVPVQSQPGSETGEIPLTLAVRGDEAVFAYLMQVQEVLPSLKITEVNLGYVGQNAFCLEFEANLRVFMLKRAPLSGLEVATVTQAKPVDLPVKSFGLPFELVSQYLGGKVKVLGIVNSGGQSGALVLKDNERHWVQVGERLGEAVISEISTNAVFLNLDGVDIKLMMGS